MLTAIVFPESVKAELLSLATRRRFVLAREILARGAAGELLLASTAEAQVVVDVARVEMMRTRLASPFWDEADPRHDPAHAQRFHEVVNGLFGKTATLVREAFDVVAAV